MRAIKPAGGKRGGRAIGFRAQSSGRVFFGGSAPCLEEVEFKRLAVLMALGNAAISSWLVTAATVRIPELPPDAFFYVHQLPSIYWLGLISTFALFALRGLVKNRARTFLEISALLLLAFYLFAVPSFPADEILPCRDLVSSCLPDLCDCEKLRPQLRSYLYSFHSQRFLVSASPFSAEPGTDSILWCSIRAPKDHRGAGPEETLDSHRYRGHAGSSDESS